jgi:hypothetical protein
LDDADVQKQEQIKHAREAEPANAGTAFVSLARLLGRQAARADLDSSRDAKETRNEEAD